MTLLLDGRLGLTNQLTLDKGLQISISIICIGLGHVVRLSVSLGSNYVVLLAQEHKCLVPNNKCFIQMSLVQFSLTQKFQSLKCEQAEYEDMICSSTGKCL